MTEDGIPQNMERRRCGFDPSSFSLKNLTSCKLSVCKLKQSISSPLSNVDVTCISSGVERAAASGMLLQGCWCDCSRRLEWVQFKAQSQSAAVPLTFLILRDLSFRGVHKETTSCLR